MRSLNTQNNILFNKVATLNIIFWLIKIISTTVGEAGADYFGGLFGPIAVLIAFALLMISIVIQIRFKRYVPWMYWTVIVLVAVFGTMFSDGVHHLGLPLSISTSIFLILLLATLGIWYASEKTLDVHSIHTLKREIFYWVVIFFTFALGTAAGDLFAGTLKLGFLDATLIFGASMIIVPALLYLLRINKIALFWIAYILTRPFGASGADLLAKPVAHGGFGLGDGTTSVISLLIVIAMVAWLTITHKQEMLHEEQVK